MEVDNLPPMMPEQAKSTAVGVSRRGIVLTSMDELARFATMVCQSGLAPKGMDKPASIAIAVEMGMEIGIPPMQAIQNIAVINGRPTVWGDLMLAICQGSPVFDNSSFSESITGIGESLEAVCTVRRLPNGEKVVRRFGVVNAKKAGLWGKAGPWQNYPERMLQMRARALALRDTFSDVLRGLYAREEVEEEPIEQSVDYKRQEFITYERKTKSEQLAEKMNATTCGDAVEKADAPVPQQQPDEAANAESAQSEAEIINGFVYAVQEANADQLLDYEKQLTARSDIGDRGKARILSAIQHRREDLAPKKSAGRKNADRLFPTHPNGQEH